MNKDTITMIAKVTNESYTNGISKGRLEAYNQIIAYLDGHFTSYRSFSLSFLTLLIFNNIFIINIRSKYFYIHNIHI